MTTVEIRDKDIFAELLTFLATYIERDKQLMEYIRRNELLVYIPLESTIN